jgi:hypothetical protein
MRLILAKNPKRMKLWSTHINMIGELWATTNPTPQTSKSTKCFNKMLKIFKSIFRLSFWRTISGNVLNIDFLKKGLRFMIDSMIGRNTNS